MKIIETINKEKPSHIVLNSKKGCYSYAYTSEEQAEEEAIIEGVIYGKEYISVIEYNNQTLFNEIDIIGGGIKKRKD